MHGRSYSSLAMASSWGWVRMAVRERESTLPVLSLTFHDATCGRGLSIVSGTAPPWGTQSLGRGKESWDDHTSSSNT